LDAQHFGVPQRRRRVFFVGHFGEPWSASAEILFEFESSDGDSASGSETGTGITAGPARGTREVVPVCATGHTHTHTDRVSSEVGIRGRHRSRGSHRD
jgi:site-specific DNA-cytosine methylase